MSSRTVHPHGRGDNVHLQRLIERCYGSPPRAWGQSYLSRAQCAICRFTPTGVGTIASRSDATRARPVHPHGRGDNACGYPRADGPLGSPPRAWGQCYAINLAKDRNRFTPTGVGTIMLFVGSVTAWTVHPHGRGDNDDGNDFNHSEYGSPPRAWGQSDRDSADPVQHRFTPTGVGTIVASPTPRTYLSVHPHGRGDNLGARMLGRIVNGSPPRAWGQYLRLRHSNAIRLQKQASKSCSASGRYSYQKEPLYLYELTICGSATP